MGLVSGSYNRVSAAEIAEISRSPGFMRTISGLNNSESCHWLRHTTN